MNLNSNDISNSSVKKGDIIQLPPNCECSLVSGMHILVENRQPYTGLFLPLIVLVLEINENGNIVGFAIGYDSECNYIYKENEDGILTLYDHILNIYINIDGRFIGDVFQSMLYTIPSNLSVQSLTMFSEFIAIRREVISKGVVKGSLIDTCNWPMEAVVGWLKYFRDRIVCVRKNAELDLAFKSSMLTAAQKSFARKRKKTHNIDISFKYNFTASDQIESPGLSTVDISYVEDIGYEDSGHDIDDEYEDEPVVITRLNNITSEARIDQVRDIFREQIRNSRFRGLDEFVFQRFCNTVCRCFMNMQYITNDNTIYTPPAEEIIYHSTVLSKIQFSVIRYSATHVDIEVLVTKTDDHNALAVRETINMLLLLDIFMQYDTFDESIKVISTTILDTVKALNARLNTPMVDALQLGT